MMVFGVALLLLPSLVSSADIPTVDVTPQCLEHINLIRDSMSPPLPPLVAGDVASRTADGLVSKAIVLDHSGKKFCDVDPKPAGGDKFSRAVKTFSGDGATTCYDIVQEWFDEANRPEKMKNVWPNSNYGLVSYYLMYSNNPETKVGCRRTQGCDGEVLVCVYDPTPFKNGSPPFEGKQLQAMKDQYTKYGGSVAKMLPQTPQTVKEELKQNDETKAQDSGSTWISVSNFAILLSGAATLLFYLQY